MKHAPIARKTARASLYAAGLEASADASALAPPAYGIGFLDRRAAEKAPPPSHQKQPTAYDTPAQMKATAADSGITAAPGNTTGLPSNLKAGIEHLSGLSLDDVHVRYNSSKPATLQALAYTQG